jgi:Amt family ammonium transporter
VGAIAVHGVGGIFGVLCVGIFANGNYGAGWNGATTDGLPLAEDYSNAKKVEGLIEGKFGQFGAQLLAAVVIILVIGGIAYAFFSIQNKLTKGGIRSEHDDEVNGLDMPEMGVHAYVD